MTKANALTRIANVLSKPGEIDLDEVPLSEVLEALSTLKGPVLATLVGRIEWAKREGFMAGIRSGRGCVREPGGRR